MRPPDEVKREIVRQWLAKAEQDMKASEALLEGEPPFLYPACFHAQQAAGKFLKRLLSWEQIQFPKTHAIEQLLGLAKHTAAEIAASLKDAAVLSPYGVDIRYPGEQPEPNLEETRQAVELARKVRNAVVNVLPVRLPVK